MSSDSDREIKRCVDHLGETNSIRRILWHMDRRVENLVEGIKQGDDCVVIGSNVINMEGPYPLKIGMKTGLIHTCSDIVVMGARPLYALNAMQVDSIEQAEEVASLVKKQSLGIGVPVIGGNTQMENGLKPCISFTVFGKLVKRDPIMDSTAKPGNAMVIIGAPIEGEVGDRVRLARNKFDTFLEVIQRVPVYAAKDASRGGWLGNLLEMMVKSKTGFRITSIPYPSFGRYMGNYLTCIDQENLEKVVEIGARHNSPVSVVGEVTEKREIVMGRKKIVTQKRLNELIRNTPFKPPALSQKHQKN